MKLVNYLKAKRKFNTFKKNGQDIRLTIVTASVYNYEYYHGYINAKIHKANDTWVVTFDYTPTMLDVKLKPTIGSFKILMTSMILVQLLIEYLDLLQISSHRIFVITGRK